MNANQIDNTVRKMLENLDINVNEMLRNADVETLNELKDEFWISLLNIQIDDLIEEKS
jgi:hypothetical protein